MSLRACLKKYKMISFFCFVLLILISLPILFDACTRKSDVLSQQEIMQLFTICICVSVLLVIGFCLLLSKIELQIHIIFIIAAIIIGTAYIIVIPPGGVPDESNHYLTAYSYSSILIGSQAKDTNGNVALRENDDEFLYRGPHQFSQDNYYRQYLTLFDSHDGSNSNDYMISQENHSPLQISPIAYIPQILGLSASRILGINAVATYYMGRLCSLFFYILLVSIAIKKAPFSKVLFFIVALLPMSLQQGMSYSYDSMLIAASLLSISYILFLAYDKQKKAMSSKDYIFLIALLVLIMASKWIYSIFFLLGVLIPQEKFGSSKKKILVMIIFCFVVICCFLIFQMLGKDKITGLSSVADTGFSIEYIFTHKKQIIAMFLRTIHSYFDFYFYSTISNYFGWLNIIIPQIFTTGYFLLLIFSLIAYDQNQLILDYKGKVLFALICLMLFLFIEFGLLIDWTDINSVVIQGVQGRYFIPMLPLLFLIFQNNIIVSRIRLDKYLIIVFYIIQTFTIIEILNSILSMN
ncbi:DUF2142 domain-containing protein [Eubacterium sp.]|uniref:DUF2142 domain-containing protein n=1 Tax=Eubacterium sp. TaxID=142586 RepID=UPI002FCCADD5